MHPADDAPPIRSYALTCSFAILVAFIGGWFNTGLIKEDGALELATVVALIMTAGVFVVRLPSLAFGPEWHLPVLTVLLALRELDFDKRFMEEGILKLRLYTGDSALGAKLIGGAVILLILVCTWRVLRRNGPSFLAALKNREGWAIAIPLGVLGVVVAKGVDGLGRKLAPLGIEITDAQGTMAVTLEELLELGFALSLLLALFLWIRRYA